MPIPKLPNFTYQPIGFMNAYEVDVVAMPRLAKYMWSDSFLDTLKRTVLDPMDTIIGCHAVPVYSIKTAGAGAIKLGNQTAPVNGKLIVNEFCEIDCGAILVKPAYIPPPPADPTSGKAYFDYDPHTKFLLYLPYIGFINLSANLIMGQKLTIKYHINVITGDLVAFVAIGENAEIVIGEYSANCAIQMPITSANYGRALQSAGAGVAGVLTGTVASGLTGNPLPIIMGLVGGALSAPNAGSPDYRFSGAIGSGAGILANKTPYLIRIRQQPVIPSKFNSNEGHLSYTGVALSALTGYTVVQETHLNGIPATDNELSEIDNLLKAGVIL